MSNQNEGCLDLGEVCLDLGCERNCPPGWDGVDIVDFGQKYIIDIDKDGLKGIKDNSVDKLRAFDFLEHIRNQVFVMNECWRVLRPGGSFHIKVPRAPHETAFADPTHVSFWTLDTFMQYFCGGCGKMWYGIKKWRAGSRTVYLKGIDITLYKP